MDALAYDALIEARAFPEIAPPPLRGTVWILGKKYKLPDEKPAMSDDIRSRIWCTYRKNFRAISGTSFTSDAGWGCTLRCGQMLLAQALVCQHLGREWRWKPKQSDVTYMKILNKFLDTRDSDYSIQMIASQGADFGRQVGQWFGPNNVAQAIKKLSAHDNWSQLAVHVALDMVVVIEDIKSLCRERHEVLRPVKISTQLSVTEEPTNNSRHSRSFIANKSVSDTALVRELRERVGSAPKSINSSMVSAHTPACTSQVSESVDYMKLSMRDFPDEECSRGDRETEEELVATGGNPFRSLLLFIPLRLGQEKFNTEYAKDLKACLTLPQSVGIIGGRPRHALYFIGYHGDYLIYLDPHTTQPMVAKGPTHIPDATYHCSQPDRMRIEELDPSIALGFFCKNENDFDDLCRRLRKDVLCKSHYNMFDLTEKRPTYWDPLGSPLHSVAEPFYLLNPEEGDTDSDAGFEIIEWPPPPEH